MMRCVKLFFILNHYQVGEYTDDVRACIHELLSLNVGVSNIAPVIHCVLKNIAHKPTDG